MLMNPMLLLSALLQVASLVSAAPQASGKGVPGPIRQYDSCAYPGTNITVIDFEYTDGQKIKDHRGLNWVQFSGFKRYYGHNPDGWSPNPSNYTTAHISWDGQAAWKAQFGSGPRAALSRVHSFWFYLGFVGWTSPGTTVPIQIYGTGPGVSYTTTIYTEPSDDGFWEHVCLDWNPVNAITFVLPACLDRSIGSNCKSAIFELDDIWVGGNSLKPYKVPVPKLEFD
ncbi:hypothetical protein DFH27DRAFT_609011 [Peziza echinospora]|nr:hypothetical protein DFH27DRAFT_609011 [Peziza echinospora]